MYLHRKARYFFLQKGLHCSLLMEGYKQLQRLPSLALDLTVNIFINQTRAQVPNARPAGQIWLTLPFYDFVCD